MALVIVTGEKDTVSSKENSMFWELCEHLRTVLTLWFSQMYTPFTLFSISES